MKMFTTFEANFVQSSKNNAHETKNRHPRIPSDSRCIYPVSTEL